jgi:glycosyltransferase involved in cell wall biosynthesis
VPTGSGLPPGESEGISEEGRVASDAPLIVTSVHSRVVEDLADAFGRAVGGRVEVRTGLDSTTWARARARGRVASLLIRVRGFLFPFRVELGPRRSDRVIIATTNPFILPAAVALRRPRARLVTLVYDLYPESLEVRLALPRPIRALIAAITAFGLRRSTAVVFLGERTRSYVVDRYSLACPTAVIPPGCGAIPRPDRAPPTLAGLARDLAGKVVISYVGNMGSMHDASTLAEAIRRTLASNADRCAVVISARGDRAEELIEPIADLPGVTVLEHLDADEWAWITYRTDIALTSLDAAAGFASLPSKVFASLAGGAAILAVAPEASDLAQLVLDLGVGVVTAPDDGPAAGSALLRLSTDPRLRSRLAEASRRASPGFAPEALSFRWEELMREASVLRLDPTE